MQWLLVALLTGAGASRAVHEALTHAPACLAHLGPWWDNRTSWKLKYKDYDADDKRPRFFLSDTALVLFTDAWHFFNAVTWFCADLAFLLANGRENLWWSCAAVLARRLVFEPLYAYLKRRNTPSTL